MTATWTCRECGHAEIPTATAHCEVCGWRPRPVLVLEGERGTRRVAVETLVGAPLLRALVGDESCFAARAQYRLRPDDETGWLVVHEPGATNPTFVDDVPVPVEGAALHDGAAVTVGGHRARVVVRSGGAA